MAVAVLSALSAVSGCSKSEVEVCIDDQMAVWAERDKTYKAALDAMPANDDGHVEIDGVKVPKKLMGPGVRNPGTELEARARANIRCGRAYS